MYYNETLQIDGLLVRVQSPHTSIRENIQGSLVSSVNAGDPNVNDKHFALAPWQNMTVKLRRMSNDHAMSLYLKEINNELEVFAKMEKIITFSASRARSNT